MTSIGSFEFPEMAFSEALKLIEGVKRDKAQTTAALGVLMGLKSTNNGYFYAKMSALSKFYGLIDREKTNIALTPLAKRIVYSVSEIDKQSAIREAILRSGLFQQLYQGLGTDYHELDFPTKLLELTKASHEEISSKSPRVEELYRDAIQYLRGMPFSEASTMPAGPALLETDPNRTPQGAGVRIGSYSTLPTREANPDDFYTFQTGDSIVRLKKSDAKLLQTAKRVIDAWLAAEDQP